MPNPDFVKGECRHCAGHLEFPAEAVGQTVRCPHCGQLTVLAAAIPPDGKRRAWVIPVIIGCLMASGLTGAFFLQQKSNHGLISEATPVPSTRSNAPTISTTAPVVVPKPPTEERTNDFAILPYKLEKTPGSSLVYVTGTVRNLSDRQRFGVKIQFELFDINDHPVGSATDYQSLLDPRAEWHFKSLVMASKAATARFNSIAEDK